MTAVVKLFLKRPEKSQGLVTKVLQAATAENDNPDIRDRAFVYWRLLSNTTDPDAAKNVVLAEKPPITTTIQSLPPALLNQLLYQLSTLSSVYHKPPEQFVGQGKYGADAVQKAAIEYVSPEECSYLSRCQNSNRLCTGSKSRMLGKIRWLQQQQRPYLALQTLPQLLCKVTSKISWISISMGPHQRQLIERHQAQCRHSTVWPVHLSHRSLLL